MVTNIDEYRKMNSRIKKVRLPSGAIFEIKILAPIDFIKNGIVDIPSDFFKFIGKIVSTGIENIPAEDNKKNLEIFENFLRVIIEIGVINPLIMYNLDKEKIDTHLLFKELSQNDQLALIRIITGRLEPVEVE